MKRCEFIINSALAIAGTALLAGCGEKNLIKPKIRLSEENTKT